ncbi:hypothetical protein [Haloterrigena salinisoli]
MPRPRPGSLEGVGGAFADDGPLWTSEPSRALGGIDGRPSCR